MNKRKVETVEEMISYREPMQIREILVCPTMRFDSFKEYSYPICPRCDVPIEYDYQSYCGSCGQKLKWTYYYRAKPRYAGKNDSTHI